MKRPCDCQMHSCRHVGECPNEGTVFLPYYGFPLFYCPACAAKAPKPEPLEPAESIVEVNLQPVDTKGAGFKCAGCDEWAYDKDWARVNRDAEGNRVIVKGGVFADLHGEAFKAYYCSDCAKGAPVKNVEHIVEALLNEEGLTDFVVARYILARHDGDSEGAKEIQAGMRKLFGSSWSRAAKSYGDPDDPAQRDAVLAKATAIVSGASHDTIQQFIQLVFPDDII